MSIDDSDAALRIVEAGRRRAQDRLRDAFSHQAAIHPDLDELDAETLDGLVKEAIGRAGASLWRISLAEGAAEEFGVPVQEALRHAAVSAAEQLVGPPPEPIPAPETDADAARDPAATEQATPYASPPPEPRTPPAHSQAQPWRAVQSAAEGFVPDPPAAPFAPDPEPEPFAAASDPDPFGTPSESESSAPREVAAPEPEQRPAEPVTADPEPEPEPEPVAAEPSAPEPDPAAGAPAAAAPSAAPQALRIPAVHESGIETLKQGDKDLELRLSDAGLDVLRHSSGVAIGRLDWGEITTVDVEETKKGLRGRRRSQRLQVKTARGQATFELPGLSEQESEEHLQPMLDRLRSSGMLAAPTE